MFKITVVEMLELGDPPETAEKVVRYEQTVDALNLQAIIMAINRAPRKRKAAKEPQK